MNTTYMKKYMIDSYLIQQIESYISEHLITLLNLKDSISFDIEDIIISNYNINVVIRLDSKKYVLRINIEQQSGLVHQIEYEYKIHKYLSQYKIAPEVYLIDTSRKWLPYDFILEEFISGSHLDYDNLESIRDAAKILAKLHNTPLPNPNFLIIWKDPLEDLQNELSSMFNSYKERFARNMEIVKYGEILLKKLQKIVPEYKRLFKPNSIVHTDVVNDNFIRSNYNIQIIDWEKPRIDDESYDLCVFLGKPPQLWGSNRLMTEQERIFFIETYFKYRNLKAELINNKIRIRQPFVSFRWILWAAHRKADVDERDIPQEIYEFHKNNYYRYEKTASTKNITELINNLS